MPNGSTALQLLAPETPPHAPGAAPTAVEIEVGRAVAAAALGLVMGIHDYAAFGGTTQATKTWAGAMIAKVVQLQLAAIGKMPDFSKVALTEGRRALRDHPAAVLLPQLRPEAGVAVDELLHHVLLISTKVAADEIRLRAN